MYETLLELYKGDKTRALEDAEGFGWTPETPVRFSRICGIFDGCYIDHARDNMFEDREMRWECPDCKKEIKAT